MRIILMCLWIICTAVRGKHYEFQPKILQEKAGDNKEMREFIEMCFDPKSPVNGRLKEALFQMLNEGKEET